MAGPTRAGHLVTRADPTFGRVTTQLLVASTSEVVLAAAATAAGLLAPPARQVVLRPDHDLEALATEVGDEDVELVVGTSALRTGRALTRRWTGAPIVLLAAGAAAYGPTPRALGGRLARRTERLLYAELVAGLRPLLLAERSVPTGPVPLQAVRTAVAALPGPPAVADPTTLVLGRSAAWSGALDRVERAGSSTRADLDLVVDAGPVEPWLALAGVRLVVGCATDDLLLARRAFDRPVAQLDTAVVLKHLDPFTDPRRTGATLVEATVPDLRSWTSHPDGETLEPVDLAGLMGTVAYAMEPELLAARRASAIGFLETHPTTRRRFVRRRRLTELRLPGGKRAVRAVLR